jgi:arsenate reductase
MSQVNKKELVLFLCKNNSARSQMAEGLMKHYYEEYYDVYSAGADSTVVNPLAVEVMNEIGIDISEYEAKNMNKFLDIKFDYVITLCGSEEGTCPFFPGISKKTIHHNFRDPYGFKGSETDKVIFFRQIRDEIKYWIIKEFEQHD